MLCLFSNRFHNLRFSHFYCEKTFWSVLWCLQKSSSLISPDMSTHTFPEQHLSNEIDSTTTVKCIAHGSTWKPEVLDIEAWGKSGFFFREIKKRLELHTVPCMLQSSQSGSLSYIYQQCFQHFFGCSKSWPHPQNNSFFSLWVGSKCFSTEAE